MAKKNGFTLLEVLFALTILAIGLLSLATVFPSGYMSMNNARVKENAMKLAEQGIEDLKLLTYDEIREDNPALNDIGVDVNQDGTTTIYEKRTYEVRENSPYFNLKTVKVTVLWLRVPPRPGNHGGFASEETWACIVFDKFF